MSELLHDLRKVPVLRVLIPFGLGLVVSSILHVDTNLILFLIVIVILFLLLLLFRVVLSPFNISFHIIFTLVFFLFFILSGSFFFTFSSNENPCDLDKKNLVLIGKVINPLSEKKTSLKTQLDCSHYIYEDSVYIFKQNVVVYFARDSLQPDLVPGDVWAFGGTMKLIRNKGNPGEFNYQSYMHRRNFFYTLFVNNMQYAAELKPLSRDWKYFPSRIRKRIIDSWDQSNKDVAILSALTLGYKSLLDAETKKAFSEAGAMHLLAVSGLHVGMIWWILDLLIRVPSNSSIWRTSKLLIILIILWFYAGITGFSDSVTRSVSMFSLVAFSKTIQRTSNIFNTLLLSAFILLLLKPTRIMETGFQLSYTAVFGIITIQPMLSKLYRNKGKVMTSILDLLSVSIAAQLATLPLVLLFFNQFPVWFLLTNLAAIPIVSAILALFVLFSPFILLCPDMMVFSEILLKLVHFLDYIVNTISSLPFAVIDDIPMNSGTTAILMAVFISILLLLTYKRTSYAILSIAILSVLLTYSSMKKKYYEKKSSIGIYNFSNSTIISSLHSLERKTYYINHEDSIDLYIEDFLTSLKSLPIGIRKHTLVDLHQLEGNSSVMYCCMSKGLWSLYMNGEAVLVAGKCGVKDMEIVLDMQAWDILLICRGFPVNSNVLHGLDPTIQIVGDGSLRSYEEQRLEKMCKSAFIIGREGIFLLKEKTESICF